MCYFALIGARTEPHRLREALAAVEVDTDISPGSAVLAYFPASDAVVCVTVNGCSCELFTREGKGAPLGGQDDARATPAFRAALAEAAVRFKAVRLLTVRGSRNSAARALRTRRTTSLLQFLQSEDPLVNHLICIVA